MGGWLVSRGPRTTYALGNLIAIGSSDSVAVRDTDRDVQARHCAISADGDAWWIEDLGSASGTFLNGRRISRPEQLVHGDIVRCGASRTEFEVSMVEPLDERPDDRGQRIVWLESDLAVARAKLARATEELAALRATERPRLALPSEPERDVELRRELSTLKRELERVIVERDDLATRLVASETRVAELQQIIDELQGERDD